MQETHQKLWLARNKKGGLERSMLPFDNLGTSIDHLIKVEEGGSIKKGWEKLKAKVISGGANWYLDN